MNFRNFGQSWAGENQIRQETYSGSAMASHLGSLTYDLDCFAIYWDDFVFPWPDEVFEQRNDPNTEQRLV